MFDGASSYGVGRVSAFSFIGINIQTLATTLTARNDFLPSKCCHVAACVGKLFTGQKNTWSSFSLFWQLSSNLMAAFVF